MDKVKEQDIIKMYIVENLSCKKIADIINTNPTTVFNILKKNNIQTRTKGGIYKLDADKISDMYYLNNMTLNDIANELDVTLETIRQCLITNRVYKKKSGNAYSNSNLSESFFESIDCEYKAYLLGFLITDGNIDDTNGRNTVRLSMQCCDDYILEKFKSLVCSNNTIIQDNKGCSTLNIESEKMVVDLSKLGVVPRKTWKTYLPRVRDDLMPHLIRGIIDGDGWITKYKRKNKNFTSYGIGVCGSYDLVNGVKKHLVTNLDVYDLKVTMRDDLASIVWGNKKDIINISKYIYENANIYLTRKYDKVSDLL